MRPSFWTAEKDATLRRLRSEGVDNVDIGKHFGCSVSVVKVRVRDLDLPRRRFTPAFFTAERDALLRELWDAGAPLKEIRARFGEGVSHSAISQRAQTLGLPSRLRQGFNGYVPPGAEPPPQLPPPRFTNPQVHGCPFIEPVAPVRRCGEGDGGYCAKHRDRVLPIPRGTMGFGGIGNGPNGHVTRATVKRYA